MTRQNRRSVPAAHWVVCACLLTCCCSSSSVNEVRVKPGGDAVLWCRDPRGPDVEGAEWRRPEHQNQAVFWMIGTWLNQELSFKGRVDLRDPDLKDGDISVVLKNVDQSDAGTYDCYIRTDGTFRLASSVRVKVTAAPQIRAGPGGAVTLPCRVPTGSDIQLMKWSRTWTRSDPEQDVFVWQRNQSDYDYGDDLDEWFTGRVALVEASMEGGELSVVLSNASVGDSGLYRCYVGRSNSLAPQLVSAVSLTVSLPGAEPGRRWNLGNMVTGLSVSAVVLVHVCGIYYLITRRKPRTRNRHRPVRTAEEREVELEDLSRTV